MGPQSNPNRRVRAWVLVQAERVQGVSGRIRALDNKTDEQVVIRADVIAEAPGLPYNIVVPVDAARDSVLDTVVAEIRSWRVVRDAVALKVDVHDPKYPHEASGYITQREADEAERKPDRVGRQDKSPGFNPWG
jgi:hypothetical protein